MANVCWSKDCKQGIHAQQCFFFSRNIGQLTPKIIYFHYLKKYFLDLSIQKTFYLILKTEALTHSGVRCPILLILTLVHQDSYLPSGPLFCSYEIILSLIFNQIPSR